MALSAERKREVVDQLRQTAGEALSLAVAQGQGISVAEIRGLRIRARERDIVLRVIKNSLARRALQGTDYECMTERLSGPNLFAFSMKEPGAAAKLFKEFGAEHEMFSVQALAIDGRLFDGAHIDVLANLPSREEALARLLGTMQAPIARLAGTLREAPAKLVRVLAAIRAQKEAPE